MIESETGVFEARYLELLERLYAFGDHRSEARDALNHRIGGFIEAGLLLEVTSAERLQALTDETHLRILGRASRSGKPERSSGTRRRWTGRSTTRLRPLASAEGNRGRAHGTAPRNL